ncbi:hypothetical protein CR513_00363, partial [Mucuna pruriens]
MKHPIEDHSLFGIDLIDELVEEHFQLDNSSESISNFAKDTDLIGCFGSLIEVANYDEVWEVHNLSNFEDVIIASNLYREQEDKFLSVLRQHKKAIGWKQYDLPRINPSIYMHRVLMEEDSKPIRQQQRRMNPTILDVVKKEVTKLLVARIIYPISDSQRVSLVQVVPKMSGMTVTKNQHDELVPMQIQNS